jgi:hypothetical protein
MITEEQKQVVERVREYLKVELSSVSREEREATHAAYEYYFAMGPRISLGDNHSDPRDRAAAFAEFSPSSYDAAKVIAAELLERGDPLPEGLAKFVAKVLRGLERPRAEKKVRGDSDLRNEILAYAVWMLEIAGIPPTKSAESERMCGCDIVADIYDDLLANDSDGVVLKPKGGEFSRARMRDIWLKDEEVLKWREWQSCLPEGD